jgi:hypothetical protein
MVTLFVNTIAIGRYTMIECDTNEVKPSADKAVGRQPSADTADPEKIE